MEFPVALEWTIAEEKLKAPRNSEYGCLESESFVFKDPATYHLDIYLNGDKVQNKGQVWIFINFASYRSLKIQTKFSVKIESANWKKEDELILCNDEKSGFFCCNRDELFDPQMKFINNGKLTILLKGVVKVNKNRAFQCDKMDSADLGVRLWESDNDKDFDIIIKDQTIKAHKIVLSATSTVFQTMFKSGFKEGQENKVEITDFPFEVVEFGIKKCYYKKEFFTMRIKQLILLLQFFEKYNMQTFKEELESYLINMISQSNVCDLVTCSFNANSSKLESYCTEFLLNCMQNSTPVLNIETLEKDFALRLLEKAFYNKCSI